MGVLNSIMIVDDHDIFRDGLSSLLKLKKIADHVYEAKNGMDFLVQLDSLKPDIVLMDISMPEMNGVDATIKATEKYPDIKILILSMFGDEEYYYQLITAGIKGFILKTSGKDELEFAIKKIAAGENYFSSEILSKILKTIGKKEKKKDKLMKINFSDREFEVVQLLCKGLSASEIAEKLFLSKKTVEGYRTKIFHKTGVKTSVELVVYAFKNNLVSIN